jgi:hypothetical protein
MSLGAYHTEALDPVRLTGTKAGGDPTVVAVGGCTVTANLQVGAPFTLFNLANVTGLSPVVGRTATDRRRRRRLSSPVNVAR